MNVTGTCTGGMPFGYIPYFNGIYIASELIIALLAIIGNSLVCLAVIYNKKLRTVTNYFLVSLSVADILVGLVGIPCAVLTDLGLPYHDMPLCLVLLSMLMVLTQSSVLCMLAVALERYMAILLPFQYQRVMSPKKANLALLVTWCLAAISGCVPLMDPQRHPAESNYCIFTCVVDMSYLVYFNFLCCFLLPLVAMILIYGHIFLTVLDQIRRINLVRGRSVSEETVVGSGSSGMEDSGSLATVGTTGGEADTRMRKESGIGSLIDTETTAVFTKTGPRASTTGSISSSASADPQPRGSIKTKSNFQEVRKATSLLLVLLLFMFCWMPIHIINSILLLCPSCNVPMWLTLVAIMLSHIHSALNPIVYAYRMRLFRRTLMRIWKGLWSRRSKCQTPGGH